MARYRISEARFSQEFLGIDPVLGTVSTAFKGTLQTLKFGASVRHESGLFAAVEGVWWSQQLAGDLSGLPGDTFWQENLQVGFRFPRRRAEVSVGILNLSDRSYHLHPINVYPDLARSRTFFAQVQLNF